MISLEGYAKIKKAACKLDVNFENAGCQFCKYTPFLDKRTLRSKLAVQVSYASMDSNMDLLDVCFKNLLPLSASQCLSITLDNSEWLILPITRNFG